MDGDEFQEDAKEILPNNAEFVSVLSSVCSTLSVEYNMDEDKNEEKEETKDMTKYEPKDEENVKNDEKCDVENDGENDPSVQITKCDTEVKMNSSEHGTTCINSSTVDCSIKVADCANEHKGNVEDENETTATITEMEAQESGGATVGPNPFLNFLSKFRKCHKNMKATDIVKEGARAWRVLPPEEKLFFIKETFHAKLQPRRSALNRRVKARAASKFLRRTKVRAAPPRSRIRGTANRAINAGRRRQMRRPRQQVIKRYIIPSKTVRNMTNATRANARRTGQRGVYYRRPSIIVKHVERPRNTRARGPTRRRFVYPTQRQRGRYARTTNRRANRKQC